MGEETESHHNYYHKTRTVENMPQRNGGDDCAVGERKANRTKSDRIADVIATVAFTDMARSAHWHKIWSMRAFGQSLWSSALTVLDSDKSFSYLFTALVGIRE